MPTPPRILLALTATCALVACNTSSPGSSARRASPEPSDHVEIQIMDGYVTPPTARLKPGGTITWLNRTSTYGAAISFPAKIKDALTCEGELGPLWSRDSRGIRSLPLSLGNAGDDLEQPCLLALGTFRYQVLLFQNLGLDGIDNPLVSLPATIVVE